MPAPPALDFNISSFLKTRIAPRLAAKGHDVDILVALQRLHSKPYGVKPKHKSLNLAMQETSSFLPTLRKLADELAELEDQRTSHPTKIMLAQTAPKIERVRQDFNDCIDVLIMHIRSLQRHDLKVCRDAVLHSFRAFRRKSIRRASTSSRRAKRRHPNARQWQPNNEQLLRKDPMELLSVTLPTRKRKWPSEEMQPEQQGRKTISQADRDSHQVAPRPSIAWPATKSNPSPPIRSKHRGYMPPKAPQRHKVPCAACREAGSACLVQRYPRFSCLRCAAKKKNQHIDSEAPITQAASGSRPDTSNSLHDLIDVLYDSRYDDDVESD
ncbi:hypothetical protein BKA62DRAFT_733866 [Auriculariales sp. MPI-PUGE-AT-0066]|nr:hypothetical protein BKA62DRAFT_733866 [Auriculariales sp. MPI-PUGE-AT-0066]